MSAEFILETQGLTKEFKGFVAVSEVDLKVQRGHIHALIGPNGAGKTTFFNLLTKFLTPTRGVITFNGIDITHEQPAETARRGIVRSFQISAVFPHMTVLENVRAALQRNLGTSFHFWKSESTLHHLHGRARALLAEVDLESFADELTVNLPYGRKRALVGYDGLMATLDAQGATVETGDFLCLYTGFADLILEMNKQPDGEVLKNSCAVLDGRDDKLLQWITDSGIVAICADNFAVEAYPAQPGKGDQYPGLPLHNHCLFKLGLNLGELWYFAELAQWLRAHQRSSFLLTAPPLRLPGAVGSPATPVATV